MSFFHCGVMQLLSGLIILRSGENQNALRFRRRYSQALGDRNLRIFRLNTRLPSHEPGSPSSASTEAAILNDRQLNASRRRQGVDASQFFAANIGHAQQRVRGNDGGVDATPVLRQCVSDPRPVSRIVEQTDVSGTRGLDQVTLELVEDVICGGLLISEQDNVRLLELEAPDQQFFHPRNIVHGAVKIHHVLPARSSSEAAKAFPCPFGMLLDGVLRRPYVLVNADQQRSPRLGADICAGCAQQE
jgi:hypothetical protein